MRPRSWWRGLLLLAWLPPLLMQSAASLHAQPDVAIKAAHAILIDADTGGTLFQRGADELIYPASMSKLMVLTMVFKSLKAGEIKPDDEWLMSEFAWRRGGAPSGTSAMMVPVGTKATVEDLLKGIIVQSGNDAAIALAELVGGSESNFVQLMNATAKRIGMTHTNYADVNGMPDPQHYTTAGDLAVLSARLIRDFPEYYSIFSVKDFTYNKIKQPNRNRLLWIDPTVDGLKTGHTKAAGYCLIASAKRPLAGVPDASRRLVAVMMGEPKEHNRVQDSLKMLNYGYTAYDALRLYKAGQVIETPRVYKGSQDTVKLGVTTDQYITLPKGLADKVKPQVEHADPLIAPITEGQQVGTVKFVADGKTLAQVPLVALQAVPQAGIVGRVWDSMMLMFNKKK